MKIIVVGGTGTLGQAVVNEFKSRHEVIVAGHSQGDVQVDIKDPASILQLYEKIGSFDALVSTTGKVHFAPLTKMTANDYFMGLQDKLMGQVNLVLMGLQFINPAGSFTLTSGILSHDPIVTSSSAAMVNGGIDAFVKAAAIELPKETRINAVSPTVFQESLDVYGDYFRGYEAVPVAKVALAFSKSVEGHQTGQVYKVGYC